MRRLILVCSVLLAASPAFAQPYEWEYRDRGDGVHLRILRDYYLPAEAVSTVPIVVIGAEARIDGTVDDDVVVIGGPLRIGPKAVVRGNVVAVGGELSIDPAARILGEIDETAVVWPNGEIGWPRVSYQWWATLAFAATLLRLVIILFVSLLIALVAPAWIRNLGNHASAVGPSALMGLAAEMLALPALGALVAVLAISVIGIPLLGALPLLIGAAMIVWTAGFAAVAARIGARLRGTSVMHSTAPVFDVLFGFIALTSITVIAHMVSLGPVWMRPLAFALALIGLAIEYVAWTIGLGAALASLFARRQVSPPPPPLPIVSPEPLTP